MMNQISDEKNDLKRFIVSDLQKLSHPAFKSTDKHN